MSEHKKPGPAGNANRGRRGIRSAVGFLSLFLALILAYKYSGLGVYFQRPAIESALASMGPWAPVGFIGIYAAGTALTVPGTLLTAMGGMAFGPYIGTALVAVGATIGASVAFLASRFLARDFVVERLGGARWFPRLEEGINSKGVRFVLFIRLVPFFPFNYVNYACGLTGISFRDYLVGTFFGIIPVSYVFCNAASQLVGGAAGERIGREFYLSLSLLAALAALSMIYQGKQAPPPGKKENNDEPDR